VRVLQINSVCGIGSTGRIATDIDNLLRQRGHESYIAYGRGQSLHCGSTIKIGTNQDVYKHVIKTRLLDKHGLGSKRSTLKFISEVKKLDPDIIHLHNIHGYYLHIEILFDFLKSVGKPIIWTLHDCWPFTGHCSYFDYVQCDRWKTGCYNCPQKISYPASWGLDNSNTNYKLKKRVFGGVKNLTIVTPSRWLASIVEKSFLNEYSVKIINNGVDLSVFKPTESDFREKHNLNGKYIILGVASIWEQRKGFNYFLKLAEQLTDSDVIVLVGLSESQISKLPKNIIGISKTNNLHELAKIYSAADVFFNPTLEDNFPTTNIEALACGTPVITFNTGGSIETIDEKSGIIIEKGNIPSLIEAISKIKEIGSYKESCISRARRLYNKNDRFSEYIFSYESAINVT